jgi:hypothetical protein
MDGSEEYLASIFRVEQYYYFFLLFLVRSLGTADTTGLLYQSRMIGDGDCGKIGGMIGKGNRSTRRKPAPAPLSSPQISVPVNISFFNLRGETFGTAATTGLLYQSRMIGDGDCGEIGGMIGKGN